MGFRTLHVILATGALTLGAACSDEAAAAREGATEGAYFECMGGAL